MMIKFNLLVNTYNAIIIILKLEESTQAVHVYHIYKEKGKYDTRNYPAHSPYLRRLEIVFIFPRLVLQILFQLQFGLSYQCEIYHRHK